MGTLYQEIRLQGLSPSETQDMMKSLLKTKTTPIELWRFIQERVEGNPFYVEEVINSLIESGTLTRDNGCWRLTRPLIESGIPPTVQGVITARLDRLEKKMKRVLQVASVIGRAFPYEILKKTTERTAHIDRYLNGLERIDLIRTRSVQPDLEYVFKHALTHEVVYNGLLKKERQVLHERIALVMEQSFCDRLSGLYETLAFHFKEGQSLHKAVDYLVKSGEKSLKRYAVEESHQYFKEAFDLLADQPVKTKEQGGLLIDLLIKWAYVFYYRGNFRELCDLLGAHENLAESLDDRARLGMFYGWLGMALWSREKFSDSYQYLCKALEVGEEINDQQIIGYACAWLTWTCAELGLLDEAILFGERAQEISRSFGSDHYLYFKSLGGMGHAYWFRGERKKALEAGKALLDYGQRHSNIRSMVMGHYVMGCSHFMDGDFPSAIECYQKAIEVSEDPYYSQFPSLLLGLSYLSTGEFQKAEDALQECCAFSQNSGTETIGTPGRILLGVVSIAKGYLSRGIKILQDGQRVLLENHRRCGYSQSEHILGKLYLQIVEGAWPASFSMISRNIGFLVKNLLFVSKKAEDHFNKAIEVAKEIGAKGTVGTAYLDLGLLHKAKGRKDQARDCISTAIQIFEQCEVEIYLRQAKEALESLG